MTTRNTIIALILVAVASAGITRYYFPQVEFKNTETVKEVIKNDIKTIVKVIEHKDGTKETVTETTDKSTTKGSSTSNTQIAAKPQWMFDVGARVKFSELGNGNAIIYDIQAQRRIMGPFYLGARYSTDASVGVSVGMEF